MCAEKLVTTVTVHQQHLEKALYSFVSTELERFLKSSTLGAVFSGSQLQQPTVVMQTDTQTAKKVLGFHWETWSCKWGLSVL